MHPNPAIDFAQDLASILKASPTLSSHHLHHAFANGTTGSVSSHHHHPSTPAPQLPSYDDYHRPPHNIFDVSAPQPVTQHSTHHYTTSSSAAASRFSIPVPTPSHYRHGSGSYHPASDSPFSPHSPFSPLSDASFPHHLPLPSPLPPLNLNGHLPPSHEELSSTTSPLAVGLEMAHLQQTGEFGREISPSMEDAVTRSRSRSKPPSGANIAGRSRLSKKRASISGIDRPHPPAIMIPSSVTSNGINGSRPSTGSSSAPMSAPHHQTIMGWPNHPAYSLPISDSLGHAHKYGMAMSPQMHTKKEESPELDPINKQSVFRCRENKALMKLRAAAVNEKRRRRRESHNAVERRRRDNINEKISELATLIPECMLDPGTPSGAKDLGMEVFNATTQTGEDGEGKEPPVIKANKGMILRKSVDYIRYLQQLVTAQASRNRDLEAQIQRLTHQSGSVDSSSSALTPEGTTLDLSQQNFHVFGEDLLGDVGGVNGMGMGVEDILQTLNPQDGDDYLAMQFGHHGEKANLNGNTNENLGCGSGSVSGNEGDPPTREIDMEDDESGTSADSPLAREGEEERGRGREWTRVAEGKEETLAVPPSSATAARGGEEKVAIKEEETPMVVV